MSRILHTAGMCTCVLAVIVGVYPIVYSLATGRFAVAVSQVEFFLGCLGLGLLAVSSWVRSYE